MTFRQQCQIVISILLSVFFPTVLFIYFFLVHGILYFWKHFSLKASMWQTFVCANHVHSVVEVLSSIVQSSDSQLTEMY